MKKPIEYPMLIRVKPIFVQTCLNTSSQIGSKLKVYGCADNLNLSKNNRVI